MTKYVAKFEGQIVGKRKSDRVYTHAIVGIWDIEAARDRVYNYAGDETEKSNFRYYTKIAACAGQIFEVRSWEKDVVGQTTHKGNPGQPPHHLSHTAEDIARAKADIANGWEGYVAALRQHKIERFEESAAVGAKPFVIAWAGRPDLAEKRALTAANDHAKYRNTILLGVVPAEIA
jgi:hypothetical protein